MQQYYIKHVKSGHILFSVSCRSLRECVERAVAQNVSLAYADLRFANLTNAQMDGACLDGADLSEANLTGANMTETSLKNAHIINAQLYGTTLCESLLYNTDFRGCLFGGTDLSCARLQRCAFDTLSALELNFRDASYMERCRYESAEGYICEFSYPPVLVKGLDNILCGFDRYLMVGRHILNQDGSLADIPSALHDFIKRNNVLITDILGRIPQNNPATQQVA